MFNINSPLARYLRYSLWACLYLVLLTPLLVGGRFVFPFISLKVFYFRFIIELALFIYLLLLIFCRWYRPRFHKLTIAILVFGLIVLLTGLTGVNPYRSFWSTIERGEGSLTISHLIIYCFLLSQTLRSRRQWLSYFSASVFISVLVGLYALAQEHIQISWIVSAATGRLSSTLGNPAYLGAYALGHLWLSLLLFFEYKKIPAKIITGLVIIFELYVLWQTETRGAILSLVVTLPPLFIALAVFWPRRRVKVISLSLLSILLLSVIFVWSNRYSPWIVKSNTLNRVATISLSDITTQSRILAWDSSWRGWRERFLLGYGWDNYNIAFNKYFHPEIFRDNGSQIWFDRAHNTVFDVAVSAGLLGLIGYLAIFGLGFFYLFKFLLKDRANLPIYLLSAAFLFGHFVQNIFVFDCLPTYIMLFMVLAFVCFIVNKHQGLYRSGLSEENYQPLQYFLSAACLVFLILAVIIFNYRPAKANALALEGLKKFYLGQIGDGISTMQQAIALNTYHTPEIRQKLTDNILNFNRSEYISDQKQLKDNYGMAFSAIKANIDESPIDVQNYLYLMILYNAATPTDHTLPSQVLRLGEQALKLSPTRPQIYFEMGQAAINLGSFKEGTNYFQKGVALSPKNLDARWLLLTAYIITGQNEEAASEYNTMIDLGLSENIANLERLVNLYSLTKNYPTLISLYQKLINLKPENIDYWRQLAAIYQNSGDQTSFNKLLTDFLATHPGMTVNDLIFNP